MAFAVGSAREYLICPRILCVLLFNFLLTDPVSAGWLDKLKETVGVGASSTQSLSTEEVGSGLKEALRVGTETVVGNLGKPDGFNLDPEIHIPLPNELDEVKVVLDKVGMDSMLVDLESRLNRAAEIATPKAKALFLQSINDMTLDDVMAIYQGPDDAATEYFRGKMTGPLAVEMKPVVDQSLSEVGAVNAYNDIMARYNAVPFAPKVDADLSNYVVAKGMDGIFYYLAQEEAAIRQNPAKRTTDLLKQVFGSNR
jgi:hypothetical protein